MQLISNTHPLIVELFPLLVLIPAAATFIIVLALRNRQIKPNPMPLPMTRKQVVICINLAVFVPFLSMVGSLILYSVNDNMAAYSFYLSSQVLHGVICVFVGIVAGLLLAMAYGYYGVSSFTVLAFLMCIPSLLTLQFGVSASALNLLLNISDVLVFLYLVCWFRPKKWLMQSFSGWFMQRMLPVGPPSDQARTEFFRRVASFYVIEVLHKLRSRSASGSDALADEILAGFLGASGPVGEFIRATEAKLQTGSSSESTQLPHTLPFVRRQLLPAGEWKMNERQFQRRVLANRTLFLLSELLLAGACLLFSSAPLSYASQWSFALLSGLILVVALLAVFDPLFRGRRMDATSATLLLLAPLKGIETELSVPTEREPVSSGLPLQREQEVVEGSSPPVLLSPDSIKRQPSYLRFFLTRVAKGADEVYEESVWPQWMVKVDVVALPLCILALMAAYNEPNVLPLALLISGLFLSYNIMAGVWWYSLSKRAMFRGVRRSPLSLALSYLDLTESGHTDLGSFMEMPSPPKQFYFLPLAGVTASRVLLRKLQETTTLRSSLRIKRLSMEFDDKYIGLGNSLMPCFYVALSFAAITLLFNLLAPLWGVLDLLLILFNSSVFFTLLSLVIYTRAMNRRRQSNTVPQPPNEVEEASAEVVAEVLHMLRSEYSYPLRILVVRDHPELVFTGRSFLTTDGVCLREALFIPSAGATNPT